MGWRGRIGLIYPADSDSDDDYTAMVPDGCTVHVARNEAPWGDDIIDSVRAQLRDGYIETAARLLEQLRPTSVAYACSSGSFVGGPEYHLEIVDLIERLLGVPATTGTTACDVALRTLGVRRISVVTPYDADRNDILMGVLEAQGYTISALEVFRTTPAMMAAYHRVGLGLVDILSPQMAYRLGQKADRPESEAVLIACTSFKTGPMIEPLEQDLGKPVITANQAVMWHSARLGGVRAPVPGMGALFRTPEAAAIRRSATPVA